MEDAPYRIEMCEPLGLHHERQVLTLEAPAGMPDLSWLVDQGSERRYPMQRSAEGRAYLLLEVAPWEKLRLSLGCAAAKSDFVPVTVTYDTDVSAVLANRRCSVRVLVGRWCAPTAAGVDSVAVAGPILGVRVGATGAWRGRTFFDTHDRVARWSGAWLEQGPVRTVYGYRLDLVAGGWYEMRITLDAEQCFARIEETCQTHGTDQLVWDFSGADLPSGMRLLDGGAGYTRRDLQYHFDERIGRMVCWTQYAQIIGTDGAALTFSNAHDSVGFVTLDGGAWCGRRLNALEFWTRRWRDGDPLTRRLLPPEAKADSMPSPERIRARGVPACQPHFSVEGWMGQSRRVFALTLAPLAELLPAEERDASAPRGGRIGAFEAAPDRDRYRSQQGLLRRLHAQRGLMSLQQMAEMGFGVPPTTGLPPSPDPVRQREAALPPAELARRIDDFLQARVYGFWDGSGAAAANCVVSRPVAFYMTCLGPLLAAGAIDAATATRWQAWFAFLAYLNADEGYYAGPASMRGPDDPDALDPLAEGMANQNFYTDVITLCGMAAEVFPAHPAAAAWRRLFDDGWSRQLDYHVYPDSGVWEESHTYFQHVLATVLPLFALRRARGGGDAFADARFRGLLAGALRQVSPRDADHGGKRHLLALGDHHADPDTYAWVYGVAAEGVAPHDPTLAARLAWLHREMGGVSPTAPAARAPAWADEAVQGLGYMFRCRDDDAGEVLLTLRAGSAWGHHHEDDGSIQLFAFGRCLIGDAAYGHAQDGGTKLSAAGHSRWALRDYPVTNYRWRFNRGWVVASGPAPWAHATAWCPAYMYLPPHNRPLLLPQPVSHWRTVVRLTPRRYLVLDVSDTDLLQTTRFHLPDGDVQVEGAAAHGRAGACRVSVVPLFPTGAPVVTRTIAHGHPGAATFAAAWDVGVRRHSGFLIDLGSVGTPIPECHVSETDVRMDDRAAPAVTIAWTASGVSVREGADGPSLVLVYERPAGSPSDREGEATRE